MLISYISMFKLPVIVDQSPSLYSLIFLPLLLHPFFHKLCVLLFLCLSFFNWRCLQDCRQDVIQLQSKKLSVAIPEEYNSPSLQQPVTCYSYFLREKAGLQAHNGIFMGLVLCRNPADNLCDCEFMGATVRPCSRAENSV